METPTSLTAPRTPGAPEPVPGPPASAPAWRQLALIFAARTTLNTAHRIVYPFLPALARGLNLSLAAASRLVTVRFVAGLAAPFLGPWIDRHPRRHTMELAMGLFVLAGLLLAAGGLWAAAAVAAFALFGLSKVMYDPAVHAYVGDTVPYHRRGRAIGVIEFSWSSAWLLGVPAAGLLIERYGWQAPWLCLAALGLLALGLTHAGVSPIRPVAPPGQEQPLVRRLLGQWRDLLRQPQVVALLLTSLLLTLASELPLIVYGAWLEDAFGLGLSTLGLASLVVGLAEASAEVSTTVLTDRLGKKRSVLGGLLALGGSLALLPLLAGTGLAGALAGVVLMTLSFEFAIVSLLPLATELAPGARGSLLSLNMTTFSLGRIAGATAGGWLWQTSGGTIAANALAGAACALLAALVVAVGWSEL
ncbi:MAG: MFS transporter [Anaerolineae bacterium]